MNVLIYVEPAIFRGDPLFLAPHVQAWALPVLQIHHAVAGQWALASSPSLCALARSAQPSLNTFPIPSWSILAASAYQRDRYAQALFERETARQAMDGFGPLAALAAELQAINAAFQPDLVIATAQNSLLPLAFPQARCLWIEQPPLPRLQGRGRLCIDPCGHQLDSLLEHAAERIRSLPLDPVHLDAAAALWQKMLAPQAPQQALAAQVRQAIRDGARGRRVALLVLQPADWLSWEGCLGAPITPEALLAQWAAALPEGWIGIPLYKTHARLPAALEATLAAAFPQLMPLPAELSGNVAELALSEADAVVVVSSSVAAHGLLAGKTVVVCGRTPLRAWAATSLQALASPVPSLSPSQRLALLAFLSHRYTLTLAEIADPAGPFPAHLRALAEAPDPADWLLDLSSWTPERLLRLL